MEPANSTSEASDYQRALSEFVADERILAATARQLSAAGVPAESTDESPGVQASIRHLQSGGGLSSAVCLSLLASVSARLVPADRWADMASALQDDFGVGDWREALAVASELLEAGMDVKQIRLYAQVLDSVGLQKLELAQALFVNEVAAERAKAFKGLLIDHGVEWGPGLVRWIVACHRSGLTPDANPSTGLGFALELLADVPVETVLWVAVNRRPKVTVRRLTPRSLITRVSTEYYVKLAASGPAIELLDGVADPAGSWREFWNARVKPRKEEKKMSTAVEIHTEVYEQLDDVEPCDRHLVHGCEGIAKYRVRCGSCGCGRIEGVLVLYYCEPCARYFDRPQGETTCAFCHRHFATLTPLRR